HPLLLSVLTTPAHSTLSLHDALPILQQQVSKQIRQLIRQSAPQLEEGISYNMPVFKLNGKDLIWFAAWKEHISIYPRTAANQIRDRKSTRLNSSHVKISYAVFCLKKK